MNFMDQQILFMCTNTSNHSLFWAQTGLYFDCWRVGKIRFCFSAGRKTT